VLPGQEASFSAFSRSDFDAVEWVNAALEDAASGEDESKVAWSLRSH
jgi:hypothetical protein